MPRQEAEYYSNGKSQSNWKARVQSNSEAPEYYSSKASARVIGRASKSK